MAGLEASKNLGVQIVKCNSEWNSVLHTFLHHTHSYTLSILASASHVQVITTNRRKQELVVTITIAERL